MLLWDIQGGSLWKVLGPQKRAPESSKFWRVTIRGAQPSARLSEEIASQRALRKSLRGLCGVSPRVLRGLSEGSAGFCGGPRDFPRVFGGSNPVLVTIGTCWTKKVQIVLW